jgi:immunoglobulin-binding protein 1
MVDEMVRTGKPINRADFKLVTRGFGPIGAPTMTLEQLADKEMADAMRRSQEAAQAAAEKELTDPDSEEVVDAETYRERRKDEEYRDHTRRGDGNRYNQG